jgi:hypothetical protein
MVSNSTKYYGKRAITKYNTYYRRLLMLALDMSEEQQKAVLDFAQKIFDKRKGCRKDCLIPIYYTINNKSYTSFVLDLNNSGAYIETDEYFLSGQYYDLKFVNPFSGKEISAISKIVWSSPDAMGVKFNRLRERLVENGNLKFASHKIKI